MLMTFRFHCLTLSIALCLFWSGCEVRSAKPPSETEEPEPVSLKVDDALDEPEVPLNPTATEQELQALLDRLEELTTEVSESPERRVHGLHLSAKLLANEQSPRWVHTVVMNVNVYWCDDGCVDGPAETSANDDDLLLLKPFAKSLQKLDVQHTEVTDAGLQTIAELTELEELNLSGTAIDGEGLQHLVSLDKLRSLNLRETAILPEYLQPLSALTQLHGIDLPASVLTDETLAVLGKLPNLTQLNLSQTPITDRGLEHLSNLKHLEELNLFDTKITDAGLKSLSKMTNLKRLVLSRTKVTSAGLVHLADLKQIEVLDLLETDVEDAGLVHLSGLPELNSLNLTGTPVDGHGLVHLEKCRNLQKIELPPISVHAFTAVNSLRSLQRLSLSLVRANDSDGGKIASEAILENMPELEQLSISCKCPLEQLTVENCPRLAGISITHVGEPLSSFANNTNQSRGEPLPPTSLHLDTVPSLRTIYLIGWFDALTGDSALKDITKVSIEGEITSETIRGINRCRGLENLAMKIRQLSGDPVPASELTDFPQALSVTIYSETADAARLSKLVGNMPKLQRLNLRVPGLKGADLAGLENCTQLKHLNVRGIDDPDEPLAFLNSLPDLDQCLVLGCPHIGRIRLTAQAGVQKLYFKYGRIDVLEIDGAPNLSAVYLGREAFGYGDNDARLNKLDIGSLLVRDTPKLLYLMVDAIDSTTPFSEVSLDSTPMLRSLLLRAPPPEKQKTSSRLTVEGEFSKLVQRRLFHLATDQASLDRLETSPIFKGGELVDVEVSATKEE